MSEHPQIARFVFIHAVCAETIPGCGRASNLSCRLVQMEQTAVANKPDIPAAILDNLSDPPNKLAIAVISITSKSSGSWIEPVEACVLGAKPKIAPTVSGDARNVSTTDTIGVVRVMKVAGKPFGCRVKFVHPGVGGNPQIALIVFYQILNKVGA